MYNSVIFLPEHVRKSQVLYTARQQCHHTADSHPPSETAIPLSSLTNHLLHNTVFFMLI